MEHKYEQGLQEYTAQKWALSFVFKRKSDRNISAKKKKNEQQQQKLRTNLDFSGAHRSIFRSYVRSMLLRHNVSLHSSSVKSRKRGIPLGLNGADSRYSKMDSIITLCILTDVSI